MQPKKVIIDATQALAAIYETDRRIFATFHEFSRQTKRSPLRELFEPISIRIGIQELADRPRHGRLFRTISVRFPGFHKNGKMIVPLIEFHHTHTLQFNKSSSIPNNRYEGMINPPFPEDFTLELVLSISKTS
jgi:hypothetical protein